MQSSIDREQDANWLKLFIRYNNKNRSPLRHLLFLQFLNISVKEFFETNEVIGKRIKNKKRIPSFTTEERRKEWLKLIEKNPGLNRSQLKRIGKGLHTWIYLNDRDWYDKVTPKLVERKKKAELIDWEKRDEKCLALAKKAVKELYQVKGKPIRINRENIRRAIGLKRWFYHEKHIKTNRFLEEVTEDIESYRIRKIKWAIEVMINNGEKITVYKVQLKAGFGGSSNIDVSIVSWTQLS
ncbi:TnsD family Tn7-like transposition protein [Tepidibacillus sp. HK-1]|uniref:TnsD family Tn7-like transposition protein n=1 Tax=Tepidibacillus sp. HK-1 TaxID=1883407 RepID=UPI00085332BC|nr:TnsD family Tn7-like transposition protein [Tepidibacillus sp. HK-1]GBF12602.1 hypothetical protein HK1_02669 [Tepidibacillus sp. HK-1]